MKSAVGEEATSANPQRAAAHRVWVARVVDVAGVLLTLRLSAQHLDHTIRGADGYDTVIRSVEGPHRRAAPGAAIRAAGCLCY